MSEAKTHGANRGADPRPRAVLVAVRLPTVTEAELDASLRELERLVTTLGFEVVGEVTQTRAHLAPAAVIGEGKLEELAALTGGTGHAGATVPRKKDKARLRREEEQSEDLDDDAPFDEDDAPSASALGSAGEPKIDLVAVDHDLTPSQARNLERATGTAVLDRTGVIIDIFHRHAKSREARLQVEIARLSYTAPRLRESPGGKERQRGRGAGEAALELDRRKVRDRIAELREELLLIQKEQGVRRAHRREARRVALVGYTNAGKSSLMRALTSSEVYVEDKLFATLDTTVRALHPEVKPRILVSDTVGFIKKLPHDLVASFKSTLDEALEASLLLHIVDASDPNWESQYDVTREVLTEIGAVAASPLPGAASAHEVPSRLVMNKVDRLSADERSALERRFPDAWFISAHDAKDVASVHARIEAFFESRYETAELTVPYHKQRLVSELHESARVDDERYEQEGVVVRFRADRHTVERFRSLLAEG